MIHNLVEIAALKKRIQRLDRRKISRPTGLKRLKKVDIDADVDVSLVDETQERQDDDLIFDTGALDDVEIPVEAKQQLQDPRIKGWLVRSQTYNCSSSEDKGKGIMIEPEVPLKRKDQISLDKQIARDIQAMLDVELLEEQKLARKQEEEANIALIESWENTQAMMESDRLLAERLQSKEREELTDEEKAKLFMDLMEKRRNHFAALKAQEKRNRPPTKA
ncbi:hypothetical protein Tco_0061767 [Tanacetum coccineum]